MSKIDSRLVWVLEVYVSAYNFSIIDVNEWPHHDYSLRLFLSRKSQEIQKTLILKRVLESEGPAGNHHLNWTISV